MPRLSDSSGFNLTSDEVESVETQNYSEACPQHQHMPYLAEKVFIVLILGTTVCLLGILSNLLLVVILSRKVFRKTHWTYLQVLALIDICILCTYIVVHSVWILYDYLSILFLYVLWLHYVPYLNYLIRVVMLSSSYLLVAATAERLIEVSRISRGKRPDIPQSFRYWTILSMLLFSLAFRLPVLWEISSTVNVDCPENHFGHWIIYRAPLARDPTYRAVYSLYGDSLVRVFVPFFSLLIMNMLIIVRWRRTAHQPPKKNGTTTEAQFSLASNQKMIMNEICSPSLLKRWLSGKRFDHSVRKTKRQILRSATRTMITVVTSYLLCNLLNFVITVWENINEESLRYNHDKFYTLGGDVVSLLTALNSAWKLPIYYACNPDFRVETKVILRMLFSHKPIKKCREYNNNRSFKSKLADERSFSSLEEDVRRNREIYLTWHASVHEHMNSGEEGDELNKHSDTVIRGDSEKMQKKCLEIVWSSGISLSDSENVYL